MERGMNESKRKNMGGGAGRERIKLRGRFYFLSRPYSSQVWHVSLSIDSWILITTSEMTAPGVFSFPKFLWLYFMVSFLWMTLFLFESWQQLFAFHMYFFFFFCSQIVSGIFFKTYKDYGKKNKLGRQAVAWVKSLPEAN